MIRGRSIGDVMHCKVYSYNTGMGSVITKSHDMALVISMIVTE